MKLKFDASQSFYNMASVLDFTNIWMKMFWYEIKKTHPKV